MDKIITKISQEVSSITQKLIDKAVFHNDTVFWETITVNSTGSHEWKIQEGLYNGVSGILFYFLALYKEEKENKYLTILKKGANWLVKEIQSKNSFNLSFFCGRLGSIYFLCELNIVEPKLKLDPIIRKSLKQYSTVLIDAINKEALINDLLLGKAGILIGLMKIFELNKDNTCLNSIEIVINSLLKNTRFGPEGFYWDRSPKNLKPTMRAFTRIRRNRS